MSLPIAEGVSPDRVRAVLASCNSFEDVRRAGILFHGTCEEIEGPLKGGGYDKVFWTARTPSVAQAYIPRSGIKTWISEPMDEFERETPLPPTKWKTYGLGWALKRAGVTVEDLDITWNGLSPWSWTVPPGWPTLGDYDDHIRSLGYEPSSSGLYEVSESYEPESEYPTIMRADWMLPGQLIIVLAEGIEFREPDWSEDAEAYANHNRVGDFAELGERGLHGFWMEDELQSDHLGNVGHEAIGILPEGLKQLSWMAIPAVRHDGRDYSVFQDPETAEFLAFMKDLNPAYRSKSELAAAEAPSPV